MVKANTKSYITLMRYNFRDKKILVVNDNVHSRRLLIGILKVLMVGKIGEAYESSQAFRVFNEGNYDLILADISNGVSDAIPLAKSIRSRQDSKNPYVPIIAVCGPRALPYLDRAREAGVNDIIRVPYSTDTVAEKLSFLLDLNYQQLESHSKAPSAKLRLEAQKARLPSEKEEREAVNLTHELLDHYIKHNELVLSKLKFAQDATRQCIDEIHDTYKKVREKNNTNIAEFKDFDKMWEDIIKLFMKGGLSEEDIFKIEKIITTIPKDIKAHYETLSQQDKTFMTLVESLNHNAYKRAKERVIKTQSQPNPFNGKTMHDYKPKDEKGKIVEREIAEDVFIIDTVTK